MEEYTRKCPQCEKIIFHSSKYNRNTHEKKKTLCRTCSGKLKYKKHGSHIDIVNSEVKSGNRKNGFQDKKHTPESKQLIIQSHLKNIESYKTEEFRNKISQLNLGEKNPMYGKTVFDIWVKKYGLEEANRRNEIRKQKLSIKNKGRNNPMYGKETPFIKIYKKLVIRFSCL